MINVNADAIPDELKDRDQWLLWDNRADRPKQPHWNGDHSISWSDPEDWHSFTDAVELASDHEHWGIGYVMAAENSDHARGLYRCVDIDGGVEAVTEDGVELADWVPDLDALLSDEAYVEVSPSGTGLHIPFVGHEPPEWWADCQLDDHTGVDVLENKFCTFTGNTVPESSPTVSEEPPAAWMFDAYKEINGETPRIAPKDSEESARSYDGDSLSEDEVEDALSHLNPDCGYEKWRNIGYAVHDWDAGSRGRGLFEQWSRRGSEWDSQAERIVDGIWENASQGSGCTVATLIHHAREAGWSFSRSGSGEANGGEPEEKSTRELIAEHSEEYDDASDVPAGVLSASPADVQMSDSDGVGSADADADTGSSTTSGLSWSDVRSVYGAVNEHDHIPKGRARQTAADVLEQQTSWMHVLESERLWVYDEESGFFDRHGEAAVASTLVRELGDFYAQGEKREITAILEDRNQIHREKLNARDRDAPLLCVGNGVVDLATGELKDHSPQFRFVRGLQWDFEPDAADVEPILEFLDDVTEREADRDTLLDHLAHGLMPGHPYRAFVVTYGPGGNGKTQVAELFRGFVGEENAAAVEIDELATDSFATSDLPGTYLNWGDDMAGDGGGALQDLSLLKKATGGSKIRANEKHEKTWNFTSEAALFFSANEPPRIGEQKKSIQDRIYPIQMPYTFVSDPDPDNPLQKQKVPGISDEMLEDDAAMRGMLLLAVEHAQSLVGSNGEYSQPESPEERLQKYNQSADPIIRFAGKALEPADSGMKVRKDDVYRVYQSFTDTWSERASSERGFKRQMPKGFPAELETARSRALATPDDEKDRVKCWKRIKWTDTARAEMPDWMAERYPDHFAQDATAEDDADGVETGAESERLDTSSLSDLSSLEEAYSGPGTAEIEVEVTNDMEPKPWLQAEGSVSDGNRTIDYQARGDTNPMPDNPESCTYRIRNFRLATDEFDVTVLEFRPTTEFVEVDNGMAEDDQQSVSDVATDGSGSSTSAVNKADVESTKEKVSITLREAPEDALSASVLVQRVTMDEWEDVEPDDAEAALASLLEDGRITPRPSDDKLFPSP